MSLRPRCALCGVAALGLLLSAAGAAEQVTLSPANFAQYAPKGKEAEDC